MSDIAATTGHENVLELIATCRIGPNWDFNAQKLTDEDIRILAQELQSNTSCGVLHLHLNSITDAGVFYLVEMLKVNQTLTDLYLGANDFGDQGVKMLSQALKNHNTTLRVIDLTYNRITDESVSEILNLLKVTRTLMGFMLVGNNISEEGKQKLREVAEMKNISLGVDF